MGTKDYSKRGWMLSALEDVCQEVGDAVTAGQVARRAGVSRNTAKKWLEGLCKDGRITKVFGEHVNRQEKVGYMPLPVCPECGSRFSDVEAWQEERGYGALYSHWTRVCRDCGCAIDGGTIDLQD